MGGPDENIFGTRSGHTDRESNIFDPVWLNQTQVISMISYHIIMPHVIRICRRESGPVWWHNNKGECMRKVGS